MITVFAIRTIRVSVRIIAPATASIAGIIAATSAAFPAFVTGMFNVGFAVFFLTIRACCNFAGFKIRTFLIVAASYAAVFPAFAGVRFVRLAIFFIAILTGH